MMYSYKLIKPSSAHTSDRVNRSSSMLTWCARTSEVQNRFGWASVNVHWSMFICE